MSGAGPPRGRPREKGEAKARRARLRARVAADPTMQRVEHEIAEAAAICFPQRQQPQAWGYTR